jgi:hypothetical protein
MRKNRGHVRPTFGAWNVFERPSRSHLLVPILGMETAQRSLSSHDCSGAHRKVYRLRKSAMGLQRRDWPDLHIHNGSSSVRTAEFLGTSNDPSSISSGSSTKSCNGNFVRFTGESGVVPKDEFELQWPWLRFEKVGVTGVDNEDAPEESRECAGAKSYGDPWLDIVSS